MVLMPGRNEFSVRGVLTPDSITDFESVFERIKERGHQISERIEIIDIKLEDDK